MNIGWMAKYAVVIKGEYMDMVRYLVPLNDAQILRERKRLGSFDRDTSYKDVTMERQYD